MACFFGLLAFSGMATAAETEALTVLQVLDLSGRMAITGGILWPVPKCILTALNTVAASNGRKIRHLVADDQGQPNRR